MHQAVDYNDLQLDLEDEDEIPTMDFEDMDTEAVEAQAVSEVLPEEFPDDSTLIKHRQIKSIEPSKVEIALGLFCTTSGISRTEYQSLLEILSMLRGQDGKSVPEINKLPATLGTLKNHLSQQLPLLDMRTKALTLKAKKLPTETATQKRTKARDTVTKDLHFFDPKHLFEAILSSRIADKIYQGLAEWVDSPTELWHSFAWASSVRTTSGHYAHYHDGSPLFPSDFVVWNHPDTGNTHYGRVCAVGKNFRSDAEIPGQVILMIQDCYDKDIQDLTGPLDPPMLENELILCWDNVHWLPESCIDGYLEVQLDYLSGEDDSKVSTPAPIQYPDPPKYFARRYIDNPELADWKIHWLCHSHPLRAELEIAQYGREHFESWDTAKLGDNAKCISIPLLVFIDGFGVYSNSYRTLMGFYVIPAGFSAQERSRRANVFPITLGPHGSNFDDVIYALASLRPLDKGIHTTISGVDTILAVFALNFIGDMPQQAVNSRIKGVHAKKNCRFCFAGDNGPGQPNDRANLAYDIYANGRYHYQTIYMRQEMQDKSGSEKSAYSTQWGLDDTPSLSSISPALDLVMTRPSDPAHSEYQGLSLLMHDFLKDTILTAKAMEEYHAVLRKHPFPPGWGRLPSPIHHLGSYSLAEHGRWSIIIPGLLRCWLQRHHIKPKFLEVAKEMWSDPLAYIVSSFAAVAKSNSVLMGSEISELDRVNFDSIVIEGRKRYQELSKCAANYIKKVRHEGGMATPAIPGSPSSSTSQFLKPTISRSKVEEESKQLKQRQNQHMNNLNRPNIHIGLHYGQLMEEYGLPSMCNVLIGEDKHR